MEDIAPTALALLGDKISWDDISLNQVWVLEMRACRFGVHEICRKWKEHFNSTAELGHNAYYSCILCTVLGYHWDKGENGGKRKFLCPEDLRALDAEIRNHAIAEDYLDVEDINLFAGELRIKRRNKAFVCLKLLLVKILFIIKSQSSH